MGGPLPHEPARIGQAPEQSNPTILHAANFAAPYGGNFIASLRTLKAHCEREGWAFVLALPEAAAKMDWCASLIAEGYQVRFLPDSASVLRHAWVLANLALSSNAVLIHTHFALYDVAAWGAHGLLRLRGRRLRVIWHAHSDFSVRRNPLRLVKNWLKYRIMGRSFHMVAVSAHIQKKAVEAGFNAATVRTIQNGIDLDRAVASTQSRAQVLEALNIPPDKRLLLMFGWDPLRKGVDVALNAVEQVAKQGFPVVLGLVGTTALREFVSRGALPPWLRIISPAEQVANLYQAATLFISSSRSEGLPYSVCEAMANRLPLALSDLPGVAWARKTPGALFFPSGDSAALAAALREILCWSAEEREQYTTANERLIRAEFAVTSWADQILQLYKGNASGGLPKREAT